MYCVFICLVLLTVIVVICNIDSSKGLKKYIIFKLRYRNQWIISLWQRRVFFYQWRVLFGQLTGLERKQLKILTLYRLELNILLVMEWQRAICPQMLCLFASSSKAKKLVERSYTVIHHWCESHVLRFHLSHFAYSDCCDMQHRLFQRLEAFEVFLRSSCYKWCCARFFM